MERPYMSVAEVSALLGRCNKWVYLNKDKIPGYFKLGNSIFFDRQKLIDGLKKLSYK